MPTKQYTIAQTLKGVVNTQLLVQQLRAGVAGWNDNLHSVTVTPPNIVIVFPVGPAPDAIVAAHDGTLPAAPSAVAAAIKTLGTTAINAEVKALAQALVTYLGL